MQQEVQKVSHRAVYTIYICHLRNGSRFIKKSRRKSKHIHDLLHIQINENVFADNFFFHFKVFCLNCFLFCLYFLPCKSFRNYYMHCEIIDCYFNIFLVEIKLNKEILNSVFQVPEFGCLNQYISLPNILEMSLVFRFVGKIPVENDKMAKKGIASFKVF